MSALARLDANGAPAKRVSLSQPYAIALLDYVRKHYAEARLVDADFAEQAGKALGFTVTAHNVRGWRRAAGIPAYAPVRLVAVAPARGAPDPEAALSAQALLNLTDHVDRHGMALARMQMELDDTVARVTALVLSLSNTNGTNWRKQYDRIYEKQREGSTA